LRFADDNCFPAVCYAIFSPVVSTKLNVIKIIALSINNISLIGINFVSNEFLSLTQFTSHYKSPDSLSYKIKFFMKKIQLALIFCVILSSTAKSQITKNSWMLGGLISYSSTNYNSTNYGEPHNAYNLQIKPNVGFFLIDKLATGVKTGIEKTGVKSFGTSTYSTYTNFNVGPYLRYYFLNPEKNVNILSEAAYQYGFEVGDGNDPSSKSNFVFSAGPVVYFNTVVGLEFLVSYSTYKFSGIWGSNNTVMIGLGLQVHLEREK